MLDTEMLCGVLFVEEIMMIACRSYGLQNAPKGRSFLFYLSYLIDVPLLHHLRAHVWEEGKLAVESSGSGVTLYCT